MLIGNSTKNIYDLGRSGTTATVVLRRENSLWIANLGDSPAFSFDKKKTGNSRQLTTLHRSEHQEEKERIEKSNGEVRRDQAEEPSCHRVYIKGRALPALAISRSFGDLLG